MQQRLAFTPVALTFAAVLCIPAGMHAQVRTDTVMTVNTPVLLEVISRSNDITVSGVDGNRVRVRGSGESPVEISGDARALRVDASRGRNGSDGSLEIDVPRGTTLLLRTQNGDIEVRGTGADVELRTTAGDIAVIDAARVRITTVAGDISVRDASDGVRVNTTGGDISLQGVSGDVEVSGTSSTVTLRDLRSRRVQVKVVSGDVRWNGNLVDNGRYEFSAHSGDIRLEVPRDTRAMLDVQSFNGDLITADFPVTLVPDPAALERDRNRERDRARARAVRDSVERAVAESVRTERSTRDRRDSASFERNIERSVQQLVESVMRGVTVQMESLANSLDGFSNRQLRRLQLGSDGGPLVSISTFSGDVILRPSDNGRAR